MWSVIATCISMRGSDFYVTVNTVCVHTPFTSDKVTLENSPDEKVIVHVISQPEIRIHSCFVHMAKV